MANIFGQLHIDREGGYANRPADRGGPTRFGITQAVARADGYAGDMRAFPSRARVGGHGTGKPERRDFAV